MGEEADKEKSFLGKWYIINAAKNWFATDVTFNQVEEIKALYDIEPRKPFEPKEDKFERVLMAWVEQREAMHLPLVIDIDAEDKSEGVLKAEILHNFMSRGKELTGVDL